MMASPASTVGFAFADNRDPWYWTTEEVVRAMCSPDDTNFPENTRFAKTIRENRLWGASLLIGVDNATLKEDLDVKPLGERTAVLLLIDDLRSKSAKYQQHVQKLSASVAPLSYAGGSVVSPYLARFPPPQANYPMMRYLNEPSEPPHSREISTLSAGPPVNAAQRDAMPLQAEEPQAPVPPPLEKRSDSSYLPPLVVDNNEEMEVYAAADLPPFARPDGSTLANGSLQGDIVGRLSHEHQSGRLRAGETYVVDETGCKRRRLQLGAPDVTGVTHQDPAVADGVSRKDAVENGLSADPPQSKMEILLPFVDPSDKCDVVLQTFNDQDEPMIESDIRTPTNMQLSLPEILTTVQEIDDIPEDFVVLVDDAQPNPLLSSSEVLPVPADHDAQNVDILQPTEEAGLIVRQGQLTVIDGLDQEQEEPVWQPDLVDGTQAAHEIDGLNRMRSASPDNSAALKDNFRGATNLFPQSDSAERPQYFEQSDLVDPCKEIPLEPGVAVIDSKGRKRLIPILVVKPSIEQLDEQFSSPVPSPSSEGADSIIRISTPHGNQQQVSAPHATPSSMRTRGPSQMYLGRKALLVDELFYANTAFDGKITYLDSQDAIATLSTDEDHPGDFVLLASDLFPNGQRTYVSNRINYFLNSKPIWLPATGKRTQYGVIPYPVRILKKHQPPSLTLFSSSAADEGARRVKRPEWLAVDGAAPSGHAFKDRPDDVHAFEVPQDSSLLSHLGENEIRDFDYLEKWNHQPKGHEVLPLYGDSGSEGEYDLDTWQEMEEEQSTEPERSVGNSRRKHLSADAVSEIIEESIKQLTEEWNAKKLPLLERKAWRLWVKSRRDKSSQHQLESLTKRIAELEDRLAKLKKKVKGEVWSKAMQLRKQCKSLQLTINDLEAGKWTANILRMKRAPCKPERSTDGHSSRKAERKPEPLLDGDEELESHESASESSNGSLDGFIVEDDNDSGYNHGDESIDMFSNDDVSESARVNPVTATPGDDIIEHSDDMIDHGDDHVNPGDDIIRTSLPNIHTDSPIFTSSTSSPLFLCADHMSTDEHITPGDLHLSATHGEVLPEMHTGLEISKTSPTPDQGVTWDNVIDLTQLSEPDTPENPASPAPRIKEESYRIRTPPIDNTDPFRRARKAKAEFKQPPMVSSHIVDLENEGQSQSQRRSSPSKQQLPGLWELSKIGALKWELLAERQDRRRLLTWIILHTPDDTLEDVSKATENRASAEIQPDIWKALKAIGKHRRKLREANSEGIMQVASWYNSWHNCKVFLHQDGIPPKCLESSIKNHLGFDEFYDFMLEVFSRMEANKLSKHTISSSRGSHGNKRQLRLDGDPDKSLTPYKKRKYAVPESQEAAQLRFSAQERARERNERQKLLQTELRRSGISSADASALIVNGKAGDEMITINPEIGRRIQPHQLQGIQFMWGEIVSDQTGLQGCLLAHTMGLGKTMQVITLLVTIAEASNSVNEAIRSQIPESLQQSRTLVLCPPGLVENWSDEMLMWIPAASSVHIGDIHKISAKLSHQERLFEITEWGETGGILLLGYSLFKTFVLDTAKPKSDTRSRGPEEEEHQRISSILLERPSIVVADEAHAARTASSNLTQAIAKIRSRSRIALTGSPLANNLVEYYSLIEWIAPGYLGSHTEFLAKYVEPISEGLFKDASPNEQRKGLKMQEVLKKELAPKVHRLDVSVLKNLLPGKTEFLLRVALTDLQQEAYTIYATHMLGSSTAKEPGTAKLWAWLAILALLCNHPQCFIHKLQKRANAKLTEKKSKLLLSPAGEVPDPVALEDNAEDLLQGSVTNLGISETMIEEQIKLFKTVTIPIGTIDLSRKMQMLFRIIELSVAAGDKVLVFSHSLPTLDYIEKMLKPMPYKYTRLDGRTNIQTRQQLTKDFNEEMDVCLISTRAGGQGLNMAGANRVIIVDSSFNPMHEEQAIGRAYRIGQKKHVYVYRLIVGGTFEQALQDQSLFKTQLANRVVDKKNPVRHALKGARQYLFLPKQTEQRDLEEFEGKDQAVLDKILAWQEKDPVIRSIALTETFHEETEERLTAEEERETEEMWKAEQLRRTDPAAYELLMIQKHTRTSNDITPAPGSEANKRASFTSSSSMPPRTNDSTIRSFGSAVTLTKQQALSVTSLNTTATTQRMTTPIDLVNVLPSTEPVLGLNTRVEQDTISEAQVPGYGEWPTLSVISPNTVAAAQRVTTPISLVNVLPSTEPVLGLNTRVEQHTIKTPSGSVRADSESTTDDLSKENGFNRATVRSGTKSVIESALQKQVDLGQLVVTSIPDVADTLASSMERNAYRRTKDAESYMHTLRSYVGQLRKAGSDSAAIVNRAEETLATKSRRSGAPKPPASPKVSSASDPTFAEEVANRSDVPATSEHGERVGRLVHSPSFRAPDLAQFPSLAGLMKREANRKAG